MRLTTVIHDAFEEQQVKEAAERRRYDVKVHKEPRTLVVRLYPEQDCGFIKSTDGEDITCTDTAHCWSRACSSQQHRHRASTSGRAGEQNLLVVVN